MPRDCAPMEAKNAGRSNLAPGEPLIRGSLTLAGRPCGASSMVTYTTAPTAEDIAELAERAFAAIPERLRRHASDVAIQVEDAADEETLTEMGFESELELTGLYRGTPLHLRSIGDIVRVPDLIFIYRVPILLEWAETGEDLYRLVRNVLVHEIGHHFGFSDDDIAALEGEME